jgi:hypothetical protein
MEWRGRGRAADEAGAERTPRHARRSRGSSPARASVSAARAVRVACVARLSARRLREAFRGWTDWATAVRCLYFFSTEIHARDWRIWAACLLRLHCIFFSPLLLTADTEGGCFMEENFIT